VHDTEIYVHYNWDDAATLHINNCELHTADNYINMLGKWVELELN